MRRMRPPWPCVTSINLACDAPELSGPDDLLPARRSGRERRGKRGALGGRRGVRGADPVLVGRPARLYTRMHVRDDTMLLYGFASHDERALFDLLVRVTGVGPKLALSFLSVLSPAALRRAVAAGDVAALTLVPGVGKQVAQRVLLDLKDKLGGDVVVVDGPLADVREALLALGLSAPEASEAMAGIRADGERPVDELLRQALQHIGRG